MTLAEFLLARIAEDEEALRPMSRLPSFDGPKIDPAFVLAECEAKRQIVKEHLEAGETWCPSCDGQTQPCKTLRLLALPYADHPDYRQDWKP